MMRKTKDPVAGGSSSNRILQGTSIEGEVVSDGDFRVDGTIKGNIVIAGKLVVGEKGHVNGDIKCGSATISGKLEGKLVVEELLSLEDSAVVEGDIFTMKLSIQPGAEFSGSCKMGAVVREISKNDPKKADGKRAEKIS
ncbi:MAG: cell shape determination protein CcmA [Bacteroidetes bacterium]|nr:MAG: cell shape determination protein CcmA [Bacteroidota bacterium]